MYTNIIRALCFCFILGLTLLTSGCGPDFYLSESEAAAYAGGFTTEADANNLISNSIETQPLNITFDNSSLPPKIQSTNLVTLLRSDTTYSLMEGFNHQVQLDRLNGELQ